MNASLGALAGRLAVALLLAMVVFPVAVVHGDGGFTEIAVAVHVQHRCHVSAVLPAADDEPGLSVLTTSCRKGTRALVELAVAAPAADVQHMPPCDLPSDAGTLVASVVEYSGAPLALRLPPEVASRCASRTGDVLVTLNF